MSFIYNLWNRCFSPAQTDPVSNPAPPAQAFDLFSSIDVKGDQQTVERYRTHIISGFLNLGATDGWTEGGPVVAATAFVRLVLHKYKENQALRCQKDRSIIEKTLDVFKDNKSSIESLFRLNEERVSRPRTTRICFDSSVEGSNEHAICRMVGNLATSYQPSKPFFEILVNSHSHRTGTDGCAAYYVSIHNNEQKLDQRHQKLLTQKNIPLALAKHAFYSSDLVRPAEFLREHKAKLGVNSTHILKGLLYLQDVKINKQVVGNCWFKQPMRCLLAALYIQLIDADRKSSFEQSWKSAIALYREIQRESAVPVIEKLLQYELATQKMVQSATKALQKRKAG